MVTQVMHNAKKASPTPSFTTWLSPRTPTGRAPNQRPACRQRHPGQRPDHLQVRGLDKEIQAAQERQANNGTLSAKALEHRTYEDMLRSSRHDITWLDKHNEQLCTQMDVLKLNTGDG